MRYFVYRVILVTMSVLAALLCIEPLLLTLFPFDGEGSKEIIGVALLLVVPQIEICLVTVSDKNKISLELVMVSFVWISEILSFWSSGGKYLNNILIIGSIISLLISISVNGKKSVQQPQKTVFPLIYSFIIALLIWQYMRNTAIDQYVTIGVALGYVILTEWLLHSQKYLIWLDAVVGIGTWGIAMMLWDCLNDEKIWVDQRFFRVLFVMVAMTLFYYMYLIISEKAITSKKTADSGEKKDQ